jgi:hypothetical protein
MIGSNKPTIFDVRFILESPSTSIGEATLGQLDMKSIRNGV